MTEQYVTVSDLLDHLISTGKLTCYDSEKLFINNHTHSKTMIQVDLDDYVSSHELAFFADGKKFLLNDLEEFFTSKQSYSMN